jgi:hypothetical protein
MEWAGEVKNVFFLAGDNPKINYSEKPLATSSPVFMRLFVKSGKNRKNQKKTTNR